MNAPTLFKIPAIRQVAIDAMVEYVAQPGNEDAFAGNSHICGVDQWMQTTVIKQLLHRLTISELLERAVHGRGCQEVHLQTLATYAAGQGMKELHDLMSRLRADEERWGTALLEFSDIYWRTVIADRIERGDYRRAWDDIRKASKEVWPFKVKVRLLEQKLDDLYDAMRKKGVIGMMMESGKHHFRHAVPIHGISFAFALYDFSLGGKGLSFPVLFPNTRKIYPGSYDFTHHERIIFKLAEHFAGERKKKRGRRAARL